MATILLAAEDPLVRGLFRAVLSHYGHKINEAHSQREALALMRALPAPDLLILDLGLGMEVGMEITRVAGAEVPRLPVLLTENAAGSTPQSDERLRRADCLLRMPFRILALRDALARLLGEQPARSMKEPCSWHVPSSHGPLTRSVGDLRP